MSYAYFIIFTSYILHRLKWHLYDTLLWYRKLKFNIQKVLLFFHNLWIKFGTFNHSLSLASEITNENLNIYAGQRVKLYANAYLQATEHTVSLLINIKYFCFLSNLEVFKSYLHNRDESYLTGYSITDSILWSLVVQITFTHLSSSVTFSLLHEFHLQLSSLTLTPICFSLLLSARLYLQFFLATRISFQYVFLLSSFQGLNSCLPFWILLSPMAAKQT